VDLDGGVERMISAAGQFRGEVAKADGDVGAGHAIAAALEHEVGLGHFKFLGGEFHPLADDFARAGRECPAMTHQRTRAETAGADQWWRVGIAGAQAYLVARDAEDVGDQLWKYSLVTLTGRARQSEQVERALVIEADRDFFLTNPAGRLDENGTTDPA